MVHNIEKDPMAAKGLLRHSSVITTQRHVAMAQAPLSCGQGRRGARTPWRPAYFNSFARSRR